VSNVLNGDKKQQIIALGRLGWTTRRIERETGIRRETISTYLKEAGVELRPPRGRTLSKPASPSGEVTPDPEAAETASDHSGIDIELSKPASPDDQVTPDPEPQSAPASSTPAGHSPSASSCEPFREAVELALSQGRNAKAIWQDLVDTHGFTGS
jgi:hypothetical protein